MKASDNILLSFAAPALILLALLALLQRTGNDRVQVIPAFFIGVGLILTSTLKLQIRRKKMFLAIRDRNKDEAS